MSVKIEYTGKTEKELEEVIKATEKIIDMKSFTLILSGSIKESSPIKILTPPVVSLVSESPEQAVVNIQRTDNRGEFITWSIGKNISISGDVIGINIESGVLNDSGDVVFSSDGNPIESFYIQATDNAPNIIPGTSIPLFISIDDPVLLDNPHPILTPLNQELKVEFVEDNNASSFLIEISSGGAYSVVESDASSPYVVTGLTNGTTYTVRVTAVSGSVNYSSSFGTSSSTPEGTPQLSTPTDIIFSDLGGGDVELNIVSSETGVSYVVDRNGAEVYSGVNPVVSGNTQGVTYSYRVKTQKSGFLDSEWYSESYTYQSYAGEHIEDYGGMDFYRTFFGTIAYTPLGDGTSRVAYQGTENVFDSSYVGKWLEPSRVNQNPTAYPSGNLNYFPNVNGVIYSKVISIIDGKNLIVDFEYNGRNRSNPASVSNEDATFFFDNKPAIEAWGGNPNRSDLIGQSGRIYAVLGVPEITCAPDSNYKLITDSENPASIHFMLADSFNLDENAEGYASPSYQDTFGVNLVFFKLPPSGETNIDLQWQPIGPTYTYPVVQYGIPVPRIFEDKNGVSTNYGLKRVISKNPYIVKNIMNSELGFVRDGANYVMPSQGGCDYGGRNNGIEITDFSIYRFEGSWTTRHTADFKGRLSGGVLLEWDGLEEGGQFIDMEEMVATDFSISCKWNNNRNIETNSPGFTWYQSSNQYWTGGVSTTKNPNDKIIIKGRDVWLGNNGDWWLIGDQVGITSNIVKSFNRILSQGDVIENDSDHTQNGLVKKISDTEFVTWGWSVQAGDVLTHNSIDYTISQVSRVSYTWNEYDSSFPDTDKFINAFKIVLDKPIPDPLGSVSFTVKTSVLESVLSEGYQPSQYKYDADPFGNLLYIDSNLNTRFSNIEIHGDIRATAPTLPNGSPLWMYCSIAEWTNVFLINRDGSPSYGTRSEYQPRPMRKRQLITGNDSYRVKISGGRLGIVRSDLDSPEYVFTNSPHLVRNSIQGERFIIYNPIIIGGIIAGTDNESFSRMQLGMTDGFSVDMSNSELKNNLEVFGEGTVDISNIKTNNRGGSMYYALEIWDNFSPVKNIEITGDGGELGIAVLRPLAIGEVSIGLTNWTLMPGLNNPSGFNTFQNTSDPDYCDFISINNQCVTN